MPKRVGAMVAAIGIAVTGYGIGLCEYRTPTTEFLEGEVSFSYQHADDPTTPGADLSLGWLKFDARRQYDSTTEGFTLGGSGRLDFRNLGLAKWSVSANGALRQYMEGPVPAFTFAGFEAGLDTTRPQPRLEAQAGVGYGRFDDVTPLVKAKQIDGQLTGWGVLSVPLSDKTLLAVAEAIGQQGDGGALAERVAAVVTLIEGEARRNLDPTAVLMIEHVLASTGRERYCGWRGQAGIAYELLDPKGGPRDLLLALSLDAALAPEQGSQLLFAAKISGPYWITEQYTLTLDVTFDHHLDTITSFTTRYALRLDKPRGQAPAGSQSAVFQLRFSLGWVGVLLRMEFKKVAEDPAWTQDIMLTATANLW